MTSEQKGQKPDLKWRSVCFNIGQSWYIIVGRLFVAHLHSLS